MELLKAIFRRHFQNYEGLVTFQLKEDNRM